MERRTKVHPKKEQIAEAVLKLAAREGLDAVTLRAVAQEAGVSMGNVQHHYASTSELLHVAVDRAVTALGQRMETRLHDVPPSDDPLHMLRVMADEFLGTNPEMHRLIRVINYFWLARTQDPVIDQILSRDDDQSITAMENAFRHGIEQGRLWPSIDPQHEARLFMAIVVALSADVAFGRMPSDDALATVRYHLGRLYLKDAGAA